MSKFAKPKHENMRQFVEKAFQHAKVDTSAVKRISDDDLKEIVEKAFSKAAVDKDLDSPMARGKMLQEVVERAYTKAAVDKDVPDFNRRISSPELLEIANEVLGKE